MVNLRKTAILLGLLILWEGLGTVFAQNYRSSQLEHIADYVGLPCQDHDGLFYRALRYQGYPVTVIVRNGEVTHVGYSLFTPSQRQHLSEMQCNFIERMALTADIPDFYGIDINQYLYDEQVEFWEGDFSVLKTIATDTALVVQDTMNERKIHIFSFYTRNKQRRLLTLTYPTNYRLISGLDMTEAENALLTDLNRVRVERTPTTELVDSMLQPFGDSSIWYIRGDTLFLPEVNANRFYNYNEEHGEYNLLYCEDYPKETMANLVTGVEIENQFVLDVKLVKYGYRKEQFQISLRRWIAFCLQTDCKPYFWAAWQEDNQMIDSELLMHNEKLGYCHIMKMTFDPLILGEKSGTIQARLNSYVRISNVKSLFQEND